MLRFLSQMVKLPMALLVSSMEVFVKAMHDFQKIMEKGIDTATAEVAQAPPGTADANLGPSAQDQLLQRPGADSTVSPSLIPMTTKEDQPMSDNDYDQDLSGDEVKYVSYSIIFTKPDYEATLQPERQDVVNYSTDGPNYGALKISEFALQAEQGLLSRPPELDKTYPLQDTAQGGWAIPKEDRKYVRFIYRVQKTLSKQDPNYPKRSADALDRISRKLGPGP